MNATFKLIIDTEVLKQKSDVTSGCLTPDKVCDNIRNESHSNQIEMISKLLYSIDENVKKPASKMSYWRNAFEIAGVLASEDKGQESLIDHIQNLRYSEQRRKTQVFFGTITLKVFTVFISW